jgi:hypothetical protein
MTFAKGDRVKSVPVDGPVRIGTVSSVPPAGGHLYYVEFDDAPGRHIGVHVDDLESYIDPEPEPEPEPPPKRRRRKVRDRGESGATQPVLFENLFTGPYNNDAELREEEEEQ